MAGREFTYTADPDFDYTIDEKGNTFIALRKIDCPKALLVNR